MTLVTCELIWLKQLLKELQFEQARPMNTSLGISYAFICSSIVLDSLSTPRTLQRTRTAPSRTRKTLCRSTVKPLYSCVYVSIMLICKDKIYKINKKSKCKNISVYTNFPSIMQARDNLICF